MSWQKNQKIKYSFSKSPHYIKPIIPRKKNSWDSSKYKKLKKTIKHHYSIVQDNLCAFCRTPIKFDGYGDHIEHMVIKNIKFRWMFHPENLSLACYGCNTNKAKKNTLVKDYSDYGNGYLDLPKKSTDYKIIHPHFDNFSDHIEEINLIYKPKNNSLKGRETIKMCKLNRFDLIYTRAKLKRQANKSIIKKLSLIICDAYSSKEEKEIAINMTEKIIERYKYLQSLK